MYWIGYVLTRYKGASCRGRKLKKKLRSKSLTIYWTGGKYSLASK